MDIFIKSKRHSEETVAENCRLVFISTLWCNHMEAGLLNIKNKGSNLYLTARLEQIIMQFKDPFLCKNVTFTGSEYVTFFGCNIIVTRLQLLLQFLDTEFVCKLTVYSPTQLQMHKRK